MRRAPFQYAAGRLRPGNSWVLIESAKPDEAELAQITDSCAHVMMRSFNRCSHMRECRRHNGHPEAGGQAQLPETKPC